MVKIRLRRTGSKHQPSYRIVVTESTSPRDGRFIEKIGNYNPRTQPASFDVQEDRALYWLSVGAQPSDAVLRILDKVGTLARFKRMRAGETLEALVAEAAANPLAPVDQRTRRDDIKPVNQKKAAVKEVAAATAPAPAAVAEAEAPAAEVEAEASEESTESAAE